jgi:hypothetical protein
MKIPINLLKTCPINSEIYRDSDVGDLVNSLVMWDYYNSQSDVKQSVNVDGLFVRSSTFKIHIHYPPSKISPINPIHLL